MRASTSSRLRSISSCERASRFRRSSGSVFDGRTLKCQSSASTEMPSRCETVALGRVALLQLLQLQRDVGHRRVQLARDEVARAERLEHLRSFRPFFEIELEHEQERDDARVRLREVAEVVVPGHLAAERRIVLAHPVLDVRMPDAVDERHPAGALDRLRHGPARAHVVDDLRARAPSRARPPRGAPSRSRPGRTRRVSSTKKHRSASPSNATPRSAPSSSVFRR